jgi:membrane protein YdbS with pleckstrin-like domain
MAETPPKPDVLRIVAAVPLGSFVGVILFFVFALFIGAFNQAMGMNIPVSTQVAENILSAVLLIVIIIICVAYFCWKVWTTPPTTPEFEIPETIDKF